MRSKLLRSDAPASSGLRMKTLKMSQCPLGTRVPISIAVAISEATTTRRVARRRPGTGASSARRKEPSGDTP
jgi:hypothetical protein